MSGPLPPPLPSWATADIDLTRPSAARVYDYLLGGVHNFAVDREVAEWLEREVPGSRRAAWANRSFLRRAVRYCASRGIDQFLDVGSGIPTEGNVHEVARDELPDARVVYVDLDPIAVLHGRALLAEDPRAAMVHADLREPERILADPATRELIDFDRPVAVLMVSLLDVIPDADDPAGLVARLTRPATSGSHLVLSHFGRNYGTEQQVLTALAISEITNTPGHPREPSQLLGMLGDFVPVPPGVVSVHDWRPDEERGRRGRRPFGYAVVAARP